MPLWAIVDKVLPTSNQAQGLFSNVEYGLELDRARNGWKAARTGSLMAVPPLSFRAQDKAKQQKKKTWEMENVMVSEKTITTTIHM